MPEKMIQTSSLQGGFTLIESIVIIVIISILSAIAASAIPHARDSQQLTVSGQQVQALLSSAEQKAVNELRTEECLTAVGDDKEAQKTCSNVGVAVKGVDAVIFSDTDPDRQYAPEKDFVLSRHTLQARQVLEAEEDWQTFLFEATPPSITLFADGQPVSPQAPGSLVLKSGRQTKAWAVLPYGRLEEI